MYSIFVLSSCILLFIHAFKNASVKPKLCINCKYFLPNDINNKYGKCILFPRVNENEISHLVTSVDYNFCYTARGSHDMCGKDGKKYRKMYKITNLKKTLYDDYLDDDAKHYKIKNA